MWQKIKKIGTIVGGRSNLPPLPHLIENDKVTKFDLENQPIQTN